MKKKHVERFLEFLLIGVVMGVIEDLIAVSLITDKPIDLRVIAIVLAVAVPFAAFSELVVDHNEFEFPDIIADRISRE